MGLAYGNLSIDDLKGVLNELQQQGGIIVKDRRAQAQKIQGQFNGILSGKPAAPAGGSDDLLKKYGVQ